MPATAWQQCSDIVASFDRNARAYHTEQAQARPPGMIRKILNLVGGPVVPRFATPVVLVLRCPIIYGRVGVSCFGAVKKLLEMGALTVST